ncbi:hypothetical protein CXF64_15295 [Pseudoalteromonas sp. GutCa3]|nr:hypothetical protein CXF75_07610 [Pseudoalteromonas arctica]PKG69555.1 hypothetical protein CXF64_15295 [Pseudoalteromonas sp. GutCa3]
MILCLFVINLNDTFLHAFSTFIKGSRYFKIREREVNSHLQGAYIVGEVLHLAFYKVKLDEREVNSHLQGAYIVGEVLQLDLVKLYCMSVK